MALSINVREFKRASVVSVQGRLDSSNSQQLEDAFKELVESSRFDIVADLEGLDYISSAGLHILVSTLKACRRYNRGDLRLCNLGTRVSDVLDLAGMTDLFQIFGDLVSAVGSF